MQGNWIPALATGVIFLTIGLVCLLVPERVQRFGLKYYSRHANAAKFNLFLDWMRTPGYILSLRIIGVGAIAVFLLFVLIFISETRHD